MESEPVLRLDITLFGVVFNCSVSAIQADVKVVRAIRFPSPARKREREVIGTFREPERESLRT